jgi:superfamily II DNA helicase RecQ
VKNIFAEEASVEEAPSSLQEHLVQLRNRLALRFQCEAHKIFPDRVLEEIAAKRPLCLEDAREIRGVSEGKLYTFMPEFIRLVQSWCNGEL